MSLVEVLVSVLVLAVVFTGLASVAMSAYRALLTDRQVQASTQLAQRTIEQARALPYETLTLGIASAALIGDPRVATSDCPGGAAYCFQGEALRTSAAGAGAAPVSPYTQTVSLDGTTYTVALYPTVCWQPPGSPGLCNATQSTGDTQLTRLTVWVSWPGDDGVRLQTVVVPSGCVSTTTSPFFGPCAAFLNASAKVGGGALNLEGTAGGASVNLSLGLSQAGSTLQSEQYVTTSADARGLTGVTVDTEGTSALYGGENVTTSVRTFPTVPAPSTATLPGVGLTMPTFGAGGVTVSAITPATTGGTASVGSSGTGSPCVDTVNVAIATSLPCSSAALSTGATSVRLISGTTTLPLASVAAPSTPSRVYAARQTAARGAVCAGTSGAGCASAASLNTRGEAVFVGLPAGGTFLVDGVTTPSGWNPAKGLVRVTASSRSWTVANGVSGGTPISAGSDSSVEYWNGTGYVSVANPYDSSHAGRDVPAPTFVWTSGSTQVTVDPQLLFGTTSSADASGSCTTTCTARRAGTSPVTGFVTVSVSVSGVAQASLRLQVDLGGYDVQVGYRAAVTAP